jgi:hypothetical protein
MPRFTVRSLFFVTSGVVALTLMYRDSRLTTAGVAGVSLFMALLGWYVYHHRDELIVEE